MSHDQLTADAFAASWNHLPLGSIYTFEQFCDWINPLQPSDFSGKEILELGCGNASLLLHLLSWQPKRVTGVELGNAVKAARKNLEKVANASRYEIIQTDLTTYRGKPADVAYCVGVLHHLQNPDAWFDALLENTKSGGKFHAWVYAHEGNAVVRYLVDPIRKIASRLPWWFTKHVLATLLVIPYFVYVKTLSWFRGLISDATLKKMPLGEYSFWISKRDFFFFRHVAFDQLVAPQTVYLTKNHIEKWLSDSRIKPGSTYLIFRNQNSWKFGGVRK